MKKFGLFLLLPLLSISAFNTGCSLNNKINLIYGDQHAEDIVDIDYAELDSRVKNEETFLLAIEPTSPCSCWSDFKVILKDFVVNNKVIVYHMKYEMFNDKDNFGLNIRNGYTTFAIFENGILKQNRISDNQNMFHDEDTFLNYMEATVMLPHYIYVNLDDVLELYNSGNQSVIYFARSNCGDCQYVDKYFLKEYAQRRPIRKDMYILDCEKIGIRQYDEEKHLTPESQILWNAFKVEMGLAAELNPDFGYGTGYVPTFLVVKKPLQSEMTYVSSSVYFNDTVTYQDGKYIVSQSFYSEERLPKLEYLADFGGTKVLQGMELSENDVNISGSHVSWKQEKAAKYHSPLLKQFLNYYL